MKTAVIGKNENIYTYKLAGLKTVAASNTDEVKNAVNTLRNQKFPIIFIENEFIKNLDIKFENPLILPIIFSKV